MRMVLSAVAIAAACGGTPPPADGSAWQGTYQAANGTTYPIESCGGTAIRVMWLCDCTQPQPLSATVDSETGATVDAQTVTLNGAAVMVMGSLSIEGSGFTGSVTYANDESIFGGLFTPSTEPTDLCN